MYVCMYGDDHEVDARVHSTQVGGKHAAAAAADDRNARRVLSLCSCVCYVCVFEYIISR